LKRDIVKRALKGDKFEDLNIVDAHCHLHNLYSFYNPYAGIDEMIQEADRVGVRNICIAPIEGISCDFRLGNKHLKEAMEKYPQRVYGYILINPNFPEQIDEIFEEYYSLKNVLGIKIHPTAHKYSVCGENYRKAFDKVKALGGVVLSHSWQSADSNCVVEACEKIIQAYPEVPFIIGHSGGTCQGVLKAIDVVNKYENAYMDTCGTFFSNMHIEEMAAKAHPARILYASDYPFHDLRIEISDILFADMDDGIKTDILGENFRKMLKINPKRVNA